jgi:hypothetical protein
LKKHKKRSAAPIYTFAAIWLLYALFFPLYRPWHFLLLLVLATGGSLIVAKAGKTARPKQEPGQQTPPAAEPNPQPASEIDSIIAEGALAQKEMGRLYATIENPNIRQKINQIMQVSDKIVQDAKHDPADVPQIKKFLNYYLPTTIKLLNAYDRMSDQGIEGENISGTMRNIESMLDTAIVAYRKQLDSLFANQALDIDTDIQVMNAMLAREGLMDDGSKFSSETSTASGGFEPTPTETAETSSPFGAASPVAKAEAKHKGL